MKKINMALSAELLKKFTHGDALLSEKLIAAKNLFMREEYSYINHKEELVLDWFLNLCSENFCIDVWCALRDCLNSQTMKNINVIDIKTTTKGSLIELLINTLNQESCGKYLKKKKRKKVAYLNSSSGNSLEYSLIRECAIITLETDVFRFYLRKNIDKYVHLSELTLKSAAENNDIQMVFRYIKSLRSFYDQSMKKQDLCKIFIENLLLPIVDVYSSMMNCGCINNYSGTESLKCCIKSTNICILKCEILTLIRLVVFPSHLLKNIESNLLSLFEEKNIELGTLIFLFQFLVRKTSHSSDKNVSCLYSLIFEAFIEIFSDNFSAAYKFLVIFCLFLGFEPNLHGTGEGSRFLLESANISKILHCSIQMPNKEFSYPVLKNLIIILQKMTVNLEESVNEVSFKQWMQSLIIKLLSSEASAVLYSIIYSIVELNPFIVEPIVNNIFKHVLLQRKKTDEEKESYRIFLFGILNMFIKLNRMQDLIRFNFLPTLKEVINECRQTDRKEMLKISASEVIPEGFGIIFGQAIGMLPGQICNTLLRMFRYILHHDIVEPLEHGDFDEGYKLHLSIIEQLIIHYLEGVRMAEQNVHEPTCLRFMESLLEMREFVGRLGIGLIQHNQNADALACFLRLCGAIGETQLLLLVYSPWSTQQNALQVVSSDEPQSPTDMHCLLSFLSPLQWKCVSDRVLELGDKDCQEALVALVQLKLCVLSLFGDQIENDPEMRSDVCNYLIEYLRSIESKSLDVIFCKLPKFTLLLTHLPHEQLLCVAKHIVTNVSPGFLSSEAINALRNPTLNLALATALGWVTLEKIGNILVGKKRAKSSEYQEIAHRQLVKDIHATLDFSDILSQKKYISECFLELAEKLNLSCSEVLLNSRKEDKIAQIDKEALLSYLCFLRNLPLIFLPERVQTAFAFGVLAICIVAQETSVKREKEISVMEEECKTVDVSVMKTCLELLQGLLEGPTPAKLGNLVDIGLFVRLLHRDGKCPKALLHLLFEVGVKKSNALVELATAATLADDYVDKNFNQQASPISIILLEILRKKNLSAFDKEIRDQYNDAINLILHAMAKYIHQQMESEKISKDTILPLLETFSCICTSSVEVNAILPYIDAFVSCAFSVLQNNNISDEETQKAQMLLETITRNHKLVGNDIRKNILLQSYKLSRTPELTAKLLKYAANEDFDYILNTICKPLARSKKQIKEFPDLGLPKALAEIAIPYPKSKKVERMITLVSAAAFKMILEGNHNENLREFIEYLFAVTKRPKVPLAHELADPILTTAVCALEAKPNSLQYVLEIIPSIARLLHCMVLHHFPLLEDRIPAFLLVFRSLMHTVVIKSAVDCHLGNEDIEKLTKCALHVEQLSKAIVQRSRDLKAISQFFVADLLLEIERTTIHHKIKIHIMNSLYAFMDVCDKFSIAHLSQALPPASLELFKTILGDYKKFYRYTGKV